ncbi:MAG: DUF3089 domain-containing protein [Allosphingosinicella sp.]
MRIWTLAAALAALPAAAAAQPVPAAALGAGPAPDYTKDEAWLCLPGRPDPCGRPFAVTALNANGYGATSVAAPAKETKADCFYVYPTVSRDFRINADLEAGNEERIAAEAQFARYSSVCRTFAPLYRQITLVGLARALGGEDVAAANEIAYGDVLAAWRDFLAHRSGDRPFVLIGHSQGSIHLLRLLREEIEGKPAAKRLLSAILLGWSVEVPEGRVVGGSLKSTPLCTAMGQTGCVVTFMSFREASPPPPVSRLGRAAHPGMTAACTNPAALGGGRAPLESFWYTLRAPERGAPTIAWSKAGAPPTPYLVTQGLVTGECRHDGTAGWLALTVNSDPADPRTDDIPGDVYLGGQRNPGWGTHLIDASVAQGDLIALVQAQVERFTATRARHNAARPRKSPRR